MAVVVVALLAALVPALRADAAGPPASAPLAPSVVLRKIGHPTWRPVDVHLFAAPIGTAASGYAEFGETQQALLPLHLPHPQLGMGPGTPHPPPYNREFAAGLAANGFRDNVLFTADQFSNGQGIYLVWMTVPQPGVRGSSPDFSVGRVIPNDLFPFHVYGASEHNGQTFDANLADFTVPALNEPSLTPSFDVDGASHMPIFIADNADFGPSGTSLRGLYVYHLTIVDGAGNGWSIDAHFAVV
jgi:hypothetical protein